MPHPPSPLLALQQVQPCARPGAGALDVEILPGLSAVTGDEGSGKTTLLRLLAAEEVPTPSATARRSGADAIWLDLRLPGQDALTPEAFWAELQTRCPRWQSTLQMQLCDALGLQAHLGKSLFMLSTGSRRKVALTGLLASGATVTCLDQPYDALDLPSVRVLREFLQDMAEHPTRAWVVADYEADPALPWRQVIELNT